MAETRVLVKLKEVPASVLSKLVEKGYHRTKSEAIRVAVVTLGEEFGMVSSTEEAWTRLQSETRRSGKRLPAEKVFRDLKRLETGLAVARAGVFQADKQDGSPHD